MANEQPMPAEARETVALQLESAAKPLSAAGTTTTMLDNGGIKLHRPDRRGEESRATKEPARIITMVWGERYLSDLLSMTIPAMLAPGNIPAFAEHFDCDLVIVTERRFFTSLSKSPVIYNVLKHCDVRLLPIDDLLSSWYGITLTYALVRGFADLGPKMVDTHLVFINADFILADGSYKKLAEKILQGERLVVSPSYCMVLEDTIETLRSHYDPRDCSLTVPRRDMATLIIAHRHNTVRAKTVNQQMFRIHRYDQFYWHVDDHTLLGHQLPIAVVYMRPERVLTEMPTFWDYGVISEYCPTVTPCVLGDSDDFLMGELRTDGTFRELLHLGWPSADEIAKDLSTFTTHDQRVYGRFSLTLHSSDLPPNVETERAKLQQFVDDVYARLLPPVSYRDHVFWASAFPRFAAVHAEQAAKLRSSIEDQQRLQSSGGARLREARALELRLNELEMQRSTFEHDGYAEIRNIEAKLDSIEAEYRRQRLPIEQQLDHWRALRRKELSQLNEDIASVTAQLSKLKDEPAPPKPAESVSDFAAVFRGLRSAARTGRQIALNSDSTAPARKPTTQLDLLGHLYRIVFGRLVNTTRWHPLHLVLKAAVAAITEQHTPRNTLVISSSGPLSAAFARHITGRKVTLTPKMILNDLYGGLTDQSETFDFCLCDLSVADLMQFRSILKKVRPLLAPHVKLVVFHYNQTLRDLDGDTFEFTQRLFPIFGETKISFSGSLPGALAMKWYQKSLPHCDLSSLVGRLSFGLVLAVCGPLARLANHVEGKRRPQEYPKHCTGMTIEIDLKP